MDTDMDRITIGSLATEYWLETTGFLYGSAGGKLYNFAWRYDLTADYPGVIRHNENDNSKVYQVISPGYDLCGAVVVMDAEEAKIHRGYHFFQQGVFEVSALGTLNIVFETKDLRPHLLFSISSTDAGFTLITREGITANEDGTLLPILNNNRAHTNGNTAIIRLNPTGIDTIGSLIIREARSGTGGGVGHIVAGNVNRGNELIMKANTKYLLTITNLGNIPNYFNIMHEWCEINV